MTLKEKIKKLEESINEINQLNDEGEDFDYSVAIDNMNEALPIIKKQEEIINQLLRDLDAIAKDNAGDFSYYTITELQKHLKNEKWFCENSIRDTNKLLEENND